MAHMLSKRSRSFIVVKLCITCLLLPRNFPFLMIFPLYAAPFLPTMKLQLSQLPKIVGSGRVNIRRALFSWRPLFNSIT